MGRQDNLLNLGKEYRLGFPVPLTVIATSDQIDALNAAKGAPWIRLPGRITVVVN